MREVRTYGHIKDGKLLISYRSKFDQAIQLMPDCRVELTVKKLYKRRSGEQHAFYWGVIVNEFQNGYFETTGEQITKEEAHEILKLKCNPKELTNEKTGEVLTIGGATSKMTTTEMMDYWVECRKFIYEWFGIDIPEPNEQCELFKSN